MRFVIVAFLLFPSIFQQANPSAPAANPGIEKRDAGKKAENSQQYIPDKPLLTVTAGSLEKSQPATQNKQDNAYDPRNDTAYRAYLWATIIGVAGAIGGVAVLFRQTRLLRRSVELASETAEKQLRAYVCVDSALLKFKRPDVPEVQVHYSNRGQTPAYDVRSWIHMWIERHPLKVPLPLPTAGFQMSTAILPPGARPYVQIIEKNPPVPMNAIRLVGTTEGTIYVYGEIRYRDIFQKERFTKFRLIYGGPGGVRKIPDKEEWLLNPDTEGNEAS
ncbi:MAG: hypothetical protein WBX38_13390 [Candidatus Sulfotelmatobacter sp.]